MIFLWVGGLGFRVWDLKLAPLFQISTEGNRKFWEPVPRSRGSTRRCKLARRMPLPSLGSLLLRVYVGCRVSGLRVIGFRVQGFRVEGYRDPQKWYSEFWETPI